MDAHEFSYAWRWTQPSHNVLPPSVMAQIKPLDRADEPVGWEQLWRLGLLFDLVRATDANLSTEAGKEWLRSLAVALTDRVIVRWEEGAAVETTWEVFTEYWDDFCYPASDDVAIFPPDDTWILVYNHHEIFLWGHKAAKIANG